MSISPLVKAEQRMRTGVWSMLVAAGCLGPIAAGLIWPGAASAAEREVTDSIGRLKPVHREERFEFTRKPAVKKTGDGAYEISFASAGRCDVAVAVEDTDGRMVRHLVYGVLGSNAPEPFQKDSLEQTVVWDGKDDMGRPTSQPDRCRVRVSLGLNPTFDRVYYYHPKDVRWLGGIAGLAADERGVYVFQRDWYNHTLVLFDHQGKYVRTLLPFSNRDLGTAQLDVPMTEVGGVSVPSRWSVFPGFRKVGEGWKDVGAGRLAAAAGWVVNLGDDGELLRLRQDGTTGGESYLGPIIPAGSHKPAWPWESRIALSPDGKWVYVTSLKPGVATPSGYKNPVVLDDDTWHDRVVFRVPRDAREITAVEPFIGAMGEVKGEPGAASAPEGQGESSWFQGIACDAQGRIYVCDHGRDLIAVHDPTGKLLKTIPMVNPREIDVHKKTGEIYVLCEPGPHRVKPKRTEYQKGYKSDSWVQCGKDPKIVLRKLGAMDEPKLLAEQEFEVGQGRGWCGQFTPMIAVDSWTEPTKVWLAHSAPVVRVYEERNGRLELFNDFEQEVRDAGLAFCFGRLTEWTGFAVDPVRGHLYNSWERPNSRCDDLDGPGKFLPLSINAFTNPSSVASRCFFSADGLLYVVAEDRIKRLDPAKACVEESRGKRYVVFPKESAVPMDQLEGEGTKAKMGLGDGTRGHFAVAANGTVTSLAGKTLTRWDRDGRRIADNLLTPVPNGFHALQTDSAGGLYLGLSATAKFRNMPGIVAKFAPGSKTLKNEVEAKPGETERLWSCPDLVVGVTGCNCNNVEFETDFYGRSFIPKATKATVAVLDTNGNRICEVGRYGNVDDTPDPTTSKEPIKGSDIGLAWCKHAATFPDKWLYMPDEGNKRIVRVKLGYQTEERVSLP